MDLKTVSVDNARVLIEYASIIGMPVNEICQEVGFNSSIPEDSEDRISIAEYRSIWNAFEQRSQDVNFGLHFGETASDFQRGNILCAVMMNCPNVSTV